MLREILQITSERLCVDKIILRRKRTTVVGALMTMTISMSTDRRRRSVQRVNRFYRASIQSLVELIFFACVNKNWWLLACLAAATNCTALSVRSGQFGKVRYAYEINREL